MKKQVVVIHGGDTYRTREECTAFLKGFEIADIRYFTEKDWKATLQERLGDGFQVIAPRMPNKDDALYSEWEAWFGKLVSLLNEEVVLVGHSMGGIFLAKYLSSNHFPRKIRGVFLVAAPFDEKDTKDVLGDFNLPLSLDNFAAQSPRTVLYQSSDDPIVPPVDVEKYRKALPSAEAKKFNDRGHFNGKEFPEIITDIKALYE